MTAYGGSLRYTVEFVPGFDQTVVDDPEVIISVSLSFLLRLKLKLSQQRIILKIFPDKCLPQKYIQNYLNSVGIGVSFCF